MAFNAHFRKNLFSQKELEEKLSQLNRFITQEEIYADPELKMNLLSEKVGIPSRTISFILNHHLQKGFNQYINEFRVESALAKIEAGEAKEKTLEAISLEVGFRSRSNFYRSFKQVTGQHPTAYLKQTA